MDVEKKILSLLRKKGKVKASEVIKFTGFSREYINRFFQKLRDEGKVVLIGKANNAHYIPADKKIVLDAKNKISVYSRNLKNVNLLEDHVLKNIKDTTGIFNTLPRNISDILDYAFSEMLNNAIEHSNSKTVSVKMEKREKLISFSVIDKGIGIFNNLIEKRGLNDEMEAIENLIKGKETTMPSAHSGEGIFFTSKMGDNLHIKSSKKTLIFDNILSDIFIKDSREYQGTKVAFSLSVNSKKKMDEIFKKYTDESFEFSKTEVKVDLYKMGTDYISRSQARRILSGLEKFKHIILDFKGVTGAGQAFCDEIFRVWKIRYPDKVIEYRNTDENIEFMIKRAIKSSEQEKGL